MNLVNAYEKLKAAGFPKEHLVGWLNFYGLVTAVVITSLLSKG